MPTSMLTTQEAVFDVGAADDSVPPTAKPAAFSAKVSNYPNAYVAIVGPNHLHFVPHVAGTYTVTISGHSQDGTLLPSLVVTFTVSDPPVPQATHFTASDPALLNQGFITPADPGTDTVTGTV